MAPSHLQGLNIVYPEQQPQPAGPGPSPYLSDADLLAVSNYPPELARQLDLWTNLSFHNEPDFGDPASSAGSPTSAHTKKRSRTADEEEDEEEYVRRAGPATPDGHENVVTATPIVSSVPQPPAPVGGTHQQPQFDLAAFLGSLGLPPVISAFPNPQSAQSPSLASLLTLYSQQQQQTSSPASSSAAATPATTNPSVPPTPTLSSPTTSSASARTPARTTKRARTASTRKTTNAAPATASTTVSTPVDAEHDDDDEDDDEGGVDSNGVPLNATEDKRRRNTAASARFRAKKKEREAALEKKARDLEGRVTDLERECEALRRENGWLKGLVVGVTGASSMPGGLPPSVSAALPGSVGVKTGWNDRN